MAKKQTGEPVDLRTELISAGVKHLREFGYPKCDPTNILTTMIYRTFFKSMLEGTVEDSRGGSRIHSAACELLDEISAMAK
jgi:hypothetical protein